MHKIVNSKLKNLFLKDVKIYSKLALVVDYGKLELKIVYSKLAY